MGKKDLKKTKKVIKPTESFKDMVSDATLNKVKAHVHQMIMQYFSQQQNQLNEVLNMLYTRLINVEDLLMQKLELTEKQIAFNMAKVEDRRDGLTEVFEAQSGDVVRCSVCIQENLDSKYTEEANIVIKSLTKSLNDLDMNIQQGIIGMCTGDTKVIEFKAKEQTMNAKVLVQKISRKIEVKNDKDAKSEDSSSKSE